MAVRMHAVQGQTITKQQLAPLKGPTGSADWPAVNNHPHCIPVSHHLPTHFTYLSQSLVFLYAYCTCGDVLYYKALQLNSLIREELGIWNCTNYNTLYILVLSYLESNQAHLFTFRTYPLPCCHSHYRM